MSDKSRRTVGEGLAAHVGDRLSRRWAVGLSGRKGSLLRRLGIEDPWASATATEGASDPRARREARMADRLARFDKMTGMRAAFRRVGGSALAPRFGLDLASLVFPRMIEDAPAVDTAAAQAAAAPGADRSAFVGARRAQSPWLSPKGGPARVVRGQKSVHTPSQRATRAPTLVAPLPAPVRGPGLGSPALAVAAEGARAVAAPHVGRAPSRTAAHAIASALRPAAVRAVARRALAAPDLAPEAVLRSVLGPAARLIDQPLTDGVADRALPASRLAAARLQDPRHPVARARGLKPVLSRSPSVVSAARDARAEARGGSVDVEIDALERGAAPPALRRLSASPVRASARVPRPRTPQVRVAPALAASGALSVVARASQREADAHDPREGLRAHQPAAPAQPNFEAVERSLPSELRGSDVHLDGVQIARPSAVALDRWIDPTPPADERAARVELREGRFALASRRARVAAAPVARAPRSAAPLSGAVYAQPAVAIAAVAGEERDASRAPSAAPDAAGPRRITGAAAWASRRADVGTVAPGSLLAQPTGHQASSRRPRPASPAVVAADVARPGDARPVSGVAAVGARDARSPSAVTGAVALPRIQRLVAVDSPLSAVEHVVAREQVGVRALGSTLPVTMPRASRVEGARRLGGAPAAVLPIAQVAESAAEGEAVGSKAASASGAAPGRDPAARSVAGSRSAPRTVAQLRADGPTAALPGPVRAGAVRDVVPSQALVGRAAPSVRTARAAERAVRRLEVLDLPEMSSVVPAPAAAARDARVSDARPVARAARALDAAAVGAARSSSPRASAPLALAPAAVVAAGPTSLDAAAERSAPADVAAGSRRGAAAAGEIGRAASNARQLPDRVGREPDTAAAPEQRALVRAVAHAAARVGLTIEPAADLHVAVERLAAATARADRAERSVLPRATARPERAARAQLARHAPGVVFAQAGTPPTSEPSGPEAASGGASVAAGRPKGAAGAASRPVAVVRSSATTHADARSRRAPAASRAASQGLASLSATARAAVVSLLQRRARPSALGYARLAAAGPAFAAGAERFTVAGDARRPAEAGGVEVRVRRAPLARPLDWADVRSGHELSAPELAARGAGRVATLFRTPFGEVEVPAAGGRALAGAPGVRQGRHLTRTAEGRYLPTAAAVAAGIVLPQSQVADDRPGVAEAELPAAPSRSPATRAQVPDRGAVAVTRRGTAVVPEGVLARAVDPTRAAPEAESADTTARGQRAPVKGFAPRPDLRAVLGAVDQGQAERGLPVWARRASGEPLARGTGGDFVQSLASARSEEDVVRVIVEQGGALNQVGSSLPKPVIQVIEHIRSEARAELEARVDQARAGTAPEGVLPDATRTRREPRHAATRDNVQVVKALTGLKSSGGARRAQGVGDDRVMKLARKLQQLIHLAEGTGDRDAARRQVRMAEDSAQARAEGQGPGGTADSGATKQVDIEALGREVLEMVSRELEMRRERRQEDPDGRNVWW